MFFGDMLKNSGIIKLPWQQIECCFLKEATIFFSTNNTQVISAGEMEIVTDIVVI